MPATADILAVPPPLSLATPSLPRLPLPFFLDAVAARVGVGARLAALFAQPAAEGGFELVAVLARDTAGTVEVLLSHCREPAYPALTPACRQAWAFEREIFEQCGLRPLDHPWLKPLRRMPGPDTAFFQVAGDEVHEVAVGPVHAGIIEPGHFRFQCHGETVFHLEIALGYQHRGGERALVGGPDRRTVHYIETLAGDASVGHALAHAQAVEALAGVEPPPRARGLRAVALELERLANHAGDLGALANDVAFLPTAAACGRLRGDFLNLTALLCGNRFGRGLVIPGGLAWNADAPLLDTLLARLDETAADLDEAAGLLFGSASVLARFEGTGVLPRDLCETLGIVGPAARAAGLPRDVRADFPADLYAELPLPAVTETGGDVLARARVRWREAQASVAFIRRVLAHLPTGPVASPVPLPLPADRLAVALVEGWRGAIVHVALTGADGRFRRYKVVDPSFHNWIGLALAMRDGQISDFPLCNKSFNLSYCGHDL